MGMTLRESDREYYYKKLDIHFPGLKEKYQRKYGNSYEIKSGNSDKLFGVLRKTCAEHNIICNMDELFKYMYTPELPENEEQLSLF
jgi:hypothetical protein